ncbi:hypothetical protein ACVIWV_000726 [Bradyrhizobium diazoefficiens]|uniref:DUF4917 domain-containing protein n=2 Tax=Bradyrhizobium diazoefficiens TaxID=1355477 RepID=A0A809XC24_9BRAD|nr:MULTISPECIES: DUF4917 family protein [Bradyrhizobium]MBR0866412.1 DUF4917 family protein [Bradyrhizobium diazoefficiens]MBR0890894.1 DUF4917 family protein [Bradyrhizobium diazoefficiens]MBR0922660.1 DUF4917 family protein [Bradyrhizobium diazoefficiens]MDA9389630.1 hypothetical protein [Bradyrhizobium sp. CCBAU 45394]MDA9539893.1 hypothetical protein [Bradyrhizobium sp. CCBAU 21362]
MTIPFDQAIKDSNANRSLLIGNGFSIAQGGGKFSYGNLLDQSNLSAGGSIRNVFNTLNTVDFELVMEALESAAKIEEAYGANDRAATFTTDAVSVREALIHAVREVHPAISLDIPQEQRDRCGQFLRKFGNVFTINYDLLLYWVILSVGGKIFTDGFGLGDEVDGFRTFSEDGICNTYYLHGALHLFLGEERDTLKRVVTRGAIIDEIAATIRRRNQLPLFVSEGSSTQKMARINSVPYLRYCYDKLSELTGDLFIYGHSIAENDYHLYDAVFRSSIDELYICVYKPDENLQAVKERIAPFSTRNGDIEITYVDASTAQIW